MQIGSVYGPCLANIEAYMAHGHNRDYAINYLLWILSPFFLYCLVKLLQIVVMLWSAVHPATQDIRNVLSWKKFRESGWS